MENNDLTIFPVIWNWGAIQPMVDKFTDDDKKVYGKLDKSILYCPLSFDKKNSGEFHFLLLVFGESETIVMHTRNKKIIFSFNAIDDYQYRIINGENVVDINLNSLSSPLLKISFGSWDKYARDLDAILKIIKKKEYTTSSSVEVINTTEVEDFFEKTVPNGGLNGPGCMVFLVISIGLSSLMFFL